GGGPRRGLRGAAAAAMRGYAASVLGVGGSWHRQPSAWQRQLCGAARRRSSALNAATLGVSGPRRGGGGSRRGMRGAVVAAMRGLRRVGPRRRRRRRRPSVQDLRRGGGGYAQPRVVGPRRLSAAGTARRGPTCLWAVLGPSLLHLGLVRPVLARSTMGWAVRALHGPSPSSIWMCF
ncbi:hypothetical protein EE612_058797, partial [Oryza sativa]